MTPWNAAVAASIEFVSQHDDASIGSSQTEGCVLSVWTCQRRHAGEKCGRQNAGRYRKCQGCGKPRPTRKRPKHLAALDASYAEFVALNGGDFCAICGREPSETRRLDRDHCHATGVARGLLCARCNRALPRWITPEWLRKATTYLERTAQ